MRQVLQYPGAKNKVADWITGLMPKHDVYLEPYGGSLSVLLNKDRCHIETVNDLHGEVVNFFTVLRDNPDSLIKQIKLTLFSREEYEKSYEQTTNDVERARRFCVRCWMGIGSSNNYHSGFRSGQQTHSPNHAKAWAELPAVMALAAERLKGVQIECLPAVELIRRYDTPDVFIYADPPYLPGIRKGYLYKYEMIKKDHIELLKTLLAHPGPVMISGYDNELYNQYLKGWRKAQKRTVADAGQKRIETLWMNYNDNQMNIHDFLKRGGQ